MNHSVAMFRRVEQLLLLIALLAAVTPMALAQAPDAGGTWLDIDVVAAAGLPTRTDGTRPNALFFYDTLNGVRGLSSVYDSLMVTTDGGETWTAMPIAGLTARPKGALADGFAWRASGHTTSDAGRTWRAPSTGFTDYTVSTRDIHAGISGPAGLRVSDDGGATWMRLDSLLEPLPAPATMVVQSRSWERLVSYRGNEIVAITSATGTIDAAPALYYYLLRIDVAARTMRVVELPMWRNRPQGHIIRPQPFVETPSQSRILVAEHEFDTYLFESRFIRMWRSEDAGATWSRHDTLVWIDEPSLRFFSPSYGLSSTAETRDGGVTWQRHGRPFGTVFFALDSLHRFVADSYMLTGRSSDGGRTWRRTLSSAPLRAVAAHRGNVAIARAQRSVLASSDRGETWIDVGRAGGLPDNLAHIVAMTWVDTAALPGHLIGIGAFVDERGVRTARVVASSDFGRTWTEKTPLPMLDYAAFSGDVVDIPLVLISTSGGEGEPGAVFVGGPFGLVASTDEGATWSTRSNEMPIHGLAMVGSSSGVALSGDWDNSAIGVYTTGDGGRTWRRTYTTPEGFVYPVGLTLTDLGYRIIASNFSQGHREWSVLSSYDGESWTQRRGMHDGPPLKGGDPFWSAGDRVHIVGRGASILYSRDAGASMAVHHDLLARFVHAPASNPDADAIWHPLQSARDGRDIYVVDYYRNVGRWTIDGEVLSAPTVRDLAAGLEARLLFASDGAGATLHLGARESGSADAGTRGSDGRELRSGWPGPRAPTVWLVDMRGRRDLLELIDDGAGRYRAPIDLRGLAAGAYVIVASTARGSVSLPLVVGH